MGVIFQDPHRVFGGGLGALPDALKKTVGNRGGKGSRSIVSFMDTKQS